MSLKRKLGIAAGAMVITGGLLAGAAFANEAPATAPTAQGAQARQSALSEGARAVLTQLQELRKSAMEKLQADSKSVVDQAVAEGKITQAEADKLLTGGRQVFGPRFKGSINHQPLTHEELKAKLDEAVKAGKMTQEQADKILSAKENPGKGILKDGFRDGPRGGFRGQMKGEFKGNLQSKLYEAVAAGILSQEQADKLLEQLGAARSE